eukprot:scaffold72664_cov35-Tisochrysis_lutea.AAC.1
MGLTSARSLGGARRHNALDAHLLPARGRSAHARRPFPREQRADREVVRWMHLGWDAMRLLRASFRGNRHGSQAVDTLRVPDEIEKTTVAIARAQRRAPRW